MFGPQMEKEFRGIALNNQERLKHVERYHQNAQEIADEQRSVQPRRHRVGNLLGRPPFLNWKSPAESTS